MVWASSRRFGRCGKAATLARDGLFKVTGRASPDISSPAACSAHRCPLGRYATPVAGLSCFLRGLAASEGGFLEEVVAGLGLGGWSRITA